MIIPWTIILQDNEEYMFIRHHRTAKEMSDAELHEDLYGNSYDE